MIKFENIGMRYQTGPEVLRDISFSLPKGSFHYLCGPSGAGKSSLLKLLYLAHRPTSGRIYWDGVDISALQTSQVSLYRRCIGVVYQEFRLIESLTAFDNVALPLRLRDTDEKQVENYAHELLNWVNLSMHVHAYPRQLSGGQQQRLAIARAVIFNPQILIADEPTGNIDDTQARRLLHLFDELHRSGTTVILATHNQHLIKEFPHPKLILNKGMLV